jgi:hypothetical protein
MVPPAPSSKMESCDHVFPLPSGEKINGWIGPSQLLFQLSCWGLFTDLKTFFIPLRHFDCGRPSCEASDGHALSSDSGLS